MEAIARTTHKESLEFDRKHKMWYDRDIKNARERKNSALIEKGIAPADSIIHKADDDLTDEQKNEKLALIATLETKRKDLETKAKALEEKLSRDAEEWASDMPEKFLSGPQPPLPEEPKAPAAPKEGAAAAPAEGAAAAPAAPAEGAAAAAPAAPAEAPAAKA